MAAVPTGNTPLLEFIESVVAAKYGEEAIAPRSVEDIKGKEILKRGDVVIPYQVDMDRWEWANKNIERAFQTGTLLLYVRGKVGGKFLISKDSWGEIENSEGTDGKIGKGWKTLGTGQLEQELDPNIHGKTVYLRDDNANEFIEIITGKAAGVPVTTNNGRKKKPAKRGRKLGSGSYEKDDAPLVVEMCKLIASEEAKSVWNAAEKVVSKAKGSAEIESRIKRLVERYNKQN